MSIVIDYIRLADVQSPIVLVSSLRILAAKHNELTSMYSLVMLILILILAYPNFSKLFVIIHAYIFTWSMASIFVARTNLCAFEQSEIFDFFAFDVLDIHYIFSFISYESCNG